MLSHLVTGDCICRCATCLWRGKRENELTLKEIKNIYSQAKELNFIAATLWGGEPLMRDDIEEIISYSNQLGFITTLITNGYFLKNKAKEIANSLDSLIISIDHHNPEIHNKMRGKEKIFENAIQGIKEVKKYNKRCKIIINTVLSKINKEGILRMGKLGKELGVSIALESMNTGGWIDEGILKEERNNFKLSEEEESEIFKKIKILKKKGQPFSNSELYYNRFIPYKKPYKCHYRGVLFRIEPDGYVTNCLNLSSPIGNLREKSFKELLNSFAYQNMVKKALSCNICNDSGVVECSYLWEFKPHSWLSTAGLFLKD
jgi:MoaA/NifB/PqqE/SkfB family radical SAM enzyme